MVQSKKSQHKAEIIYYNDDKKKKITKSFDTNRAAIIWARGETSGREKAFARIIGSLYVTSWRTPKYENNPDNVS